MPGPGDRRMNKIPVLLESAFSSVQRRHLRVRGGWWDVLGGSHAWAPCGGGLLFSAACPGKPSRRSCREHRQEQVALGGGGFEAEGPRQAQRGQGLCAGGEQVAGGARPGGQRGPERVGAQRVSGLEPQEGLGSDSA